MVPLKRKTATKIRVEDNWTHIRYHETDVVSFSETIIILRSGGWETVTTKRRMNQISEEYDLGFSVYQLKGKWFVSFPGCEDIEFYDGMRLDRGAP